MGGTLYPIFRPSVAVTDQPLDDIRALFLYLNDADELARELGVTPLGNFLGESMEGEVERWFSVADGLRTVRTLAAAIHQPPHDSLEWAYNIDHEFAALEYLLVRASPSAKEFCLVIT